MILVFENIMILFSQLYKLYIRGVIHSNLSISSGSNKLNLTDH